MINYILADFVSRLTVASRGHLKSILVLNTDLTLKILSILYKNGVISYFKVMEDKKLILVYLKYFQNKTIFYKIELISKPSRRIYWSLGKMSLKYNASSFSKFYIVLLQKD